MLLFVFYFICILLLFTIVFRFYSVCILVLFFCIPLSIFLYSDNSIFEYGIPRTRHSEHYFFSRTPHSEHYLRLIIVTSLLIAINSTIFINSTILIDSIFSIFSIFLRFPEPAIPNIIRYLGTAIPNIILIPISGHSEHHPRPLFSASGSIPPPSDLKMELNHHPRRLIEFVEFDSPIAGRPIPNMDRRRNRTTGNHTPALQLWRSTHPPPYPYKKRILPPPPF